MSLLVALFAREPVAGQTKTRLIPALGAEGACALYEAFLDDVAATTQQLRALHPDVELALYSAEAQPGPQLRERAERWGMGLVPQQGETLGDRMSHALSMGIARCGAALVLGTDVPTLPLRILLTAREALRAPPDTADATSAGPARATTSALWCLGPAADGGYFLGARHSAPLRRRPHGHTTRADRHRARQPRSPRAAPRPLVRRGHPERPAPPEAAPPPRPASGARHQRTAEHAPTPVRRELGSSPRDLLA
ncbi:MAG: DUF2064 domain-containing protein [Sandaracinaceae bacterium]|nr:DUF2064 domain-containing protein [Sandaracinaceae bacterium]